MCDCEHLCGHKLCSLSLPSSLVDIWVTELGQAAQCLDWGVKLEAPAKVALVIGRETDGISAEMLAAANRRLYFPSAWCHRCVELLCCAVCDVRQWLIHVFLLCGL
jgi:hypothetical protein